MATLELSGNHDALLADVARYVAQQRLAVVATLGADGAPQAALVGFALTDRFELVFDSVDTTRKIANIRRDLRVAVVIGGTMQDERTVQIDGIAVEPTGADGARVREAYFATWPDGRDRQSWPGITHVLVTPQRLRFSDWNLRPASVVEWTRRDDGTLQRA